MVSTSNLGWLGFVAGFSNRYIIIKVIWILRVLKPGGFSKPLEIQFLNSTTLRIIFTISKISLVANTAEQLEQYILYGAENEQQKKYGHFLKYGQQIHFLSTVSFVWTFIKCKL